MQHKEADFGSLFRHWIKANPQVTGAYELKQTNKDSIPFNAVESHQMDYLEAIRENKGVLMRMPGVNGEPDYIYMRNGPSWIVIKYPNSFHIISPVAFKIEKEKSKRKSLTEKQAYVISVKSVKLK